MTTTSSRSRKKRSSKSRARNRRRRGNNNLFLWLFLGVLILLVGHTINFAMGIMGGVVHSLRLNVIEFFTWSLPEEGQRFDALVKKAGD